MLKRHAQSAISLKPITQAPSTLLADVVGMTIAAIAMGVAVFSIWAAQVCSHAALIGCTNKLIRAAGLAVDFVFDDRWPYLMPRCCTELFGPVDAVSKDLLSLQHRMQIFCVAFSRPFA